MLRCAQCRAHAPETAGRCPRCGGELLASPGLLDRRTVVIAVVGTGLVLSGLWLFLVSGVYFLAFVDRALADLGYSPYQLGADERRQQLVEVIREAEGSVPAYPGASRLQERLGDNRLGTAPALDVCWGAPQGLEEVITYYQRRLSQGGVPWRIRRVVPQGGLLSAEAGQVRLLIHGPESKAVDGLDCPPGTTFIASYTAFSSGR